MALYRLFAGGIVPEVQCCDLQIHPLTVTAIYQNPPSASQKMTQEKGSCHILFVRNYFVEQVY